jgi:hypothetical protein
MDCSAQAELFFFGRADPKTPPPGVPAAVGRTRPIDYCVSMESLSEFLQRPVCMACQFRIHDRMQWSVMDHMTCQVLMVCETLHPDGQFP